MTSSFCLSISTNPIIIIIIISSSSSSSLVWFYDISFIVGYLMPNPVYTYMLGIYDLN